MNILFATSEAVPFAKTGGLADVGGALPKELARLGNEVSVIMPCYRRVWHSGQQIDDTGIEFSVPIGRKTVCGRILRSHLPDSQVPVYLIDQPGYFDRAELYGENGENYKDNCERFVFFCRAVLEAISLLNLDLNMLHVNDWQTGLVPAYLKTEYAGIPCYEKIASLFTIHNLSYQGQFWHWDMLLTGLDWKYFNWRQMEFYGNLNLMKTGLVFSDSLSTVSPRYAEEIQSSPLGCGLEGVLRQRRDSLTGIINGVDYNIWNPATDSDIPANYDVDSIKPDKPQCKAALQREMGLAERADVPLIGLIGRLVDQKGIDLVSGVMKEWLQSESAQWVILGTGEEKYHRFFADIAHRHPQQVATRLEFCNALAHRIEAGSDIFLMPSQFEPCGLNQLYSLRYGTVPVVRSTGGLADTIVNTTEKTLTHRSANGFSFADYSTLRLSETLRHACQTFHQRDIWRQIVSTGMRQDWSWARSATLYASLYEKTIERTQDAVMSS